MSFTGGFPVAELDGDAAVVDSAVAFVLVETITLAGAYASGLLGLEVGAGGALGGLKLTRAATVGGDHVDWYEDTDFNTATDDFPSTTPADIHLLAAGADGIIRLANIEGTAEIKVYAKKATTDTTLRVTGSFSVNG